MFLGKPGSQCSLQSPVVCAPPRAAIPTLCTEDERALLVVTPACSLPFAAPQLTDLTSHVSSRHISPLHFVSWMMNFVYTPDYIVNAGGAVARISETMTAVIDLARKKQLSTARTANLLAEQRIAAIRACSPRTFS